MFRLEARESWAFKTSRCPGLFWGNLEFLGFQYFKNSRCPGLFWENLEFLAFKPSRSQDVQDGKILNSWAFKISRVQDAQNSSGKILHSWALKISRIQDSQSSSRNSKHRRPFCHYPVGASGEQQSSCSAGCDHQKPSRCETDFTADENLATGGPRNSHRKFLTTMN